MVTGSHEGFQVGEGGVQVSIDDDDIAARAIERLNRRRASQATPLPEPPKTVNIQVGVQGMAIGLMFDPAPPPGMRMLPLDVVSARNLAIALNDAVRQVTQTKGARA